MPFIPAADRAADGAGGDRHGPADHAGPRRPLVRRELRARRLGPVQKWVYLFTELIPVLCFAVSACCSGRSAARPGPRSSTLGSRASSRRSTHLGVPPTNPGVDERHRDPGGSLFGLANLPYGVFSARRARPRVGVRVGDSVLDLAAALARRGVRGAVAQPVHGAGPARWAAARARITELIAAADVPAGRRAPGAGRRAAAAVRGRRLRGLLRVGAPRVQPRPAVPARRRAADAQLEAPARRLPRPGGHRRRLRHRHRPPVRPAQGTRRPRPRVRPVGPARHRGGARLRGRRRLAARHAGAGRRVRRPRVRRRPRQRLVRPRPAGLGVRAARAAPGQVVRDLGIALGRPARRPAGGPRPAARPGPAAAAVPARERRTGAWTSTWPSRGTARSSPGRRTRPCTGRPPRCSRT